MSIRRLTFQVESGLDSDTFDIAVPADTPVCALLPAIVAIVEPTSHPENTVDDWRLDRLTGCFIDDSMTLAENDVHDGEILILTSRDSHELGLAEWDPCRTVASADHPRLSPLTVSPATACAWAAIVASIALAWAGAGAHDWSYLVVAAVGACAAAIMASATGNSQGLQVAAASLAAATGFLAVPSTPSAASVFLAASACLSMSSVMLRSASGAPLIALATLSALIAMSTAAPVVGTVSTPAVGATLAAASLGLLAIAPRVAILAGRLRPDEHPDDCDARASLAHTTLTGLVVGCAGAAAIGALVVAAGFRRSGTSTLAGATFTVAVGIAVLLRARTYVDEPRRAAVTAGGLLCVTGAFAIVVTASPVSAWWPSAVVIVVGLAAVRPRQVGPGVMRMIDAIEYTALAAVLPLGCWVGGVYELIRESHLL